jgi:D-alanyl-D-alanine carboxypeptidase
VTAGPAVPRDGRRGRRGRRLVAAIGLVGVFAAGLAAGWAVSDPGAFAFARAGAASSPVPTAVAVATPGGPASPGPGASPTPAATPSLAPASSSPAPTPTPAPAASPSPTPTPPPTVPPKTAARLDQALAKARKKLALPGVQATVIYADGSTWTRALGTANVSTGRKVRPDTPFAVASVTKTFTAALILRYVDQGLVRLDDRLSRWLPDWPNAKKITIRMLLNHTSGIPDFFRNPKFDRALNKDKKRVWTSKEVLSRYVRPGVVFPPGKGWSYSNTNYVLLGLIAEKAGGASWDELVHRDLIDPLGLTSTYVQGVEEPSIAPARAYRMIDGDRGPVPRARTDGTDVVPFTSVVTAAGSAGAIASTTQDLARWARALYGGSLLTSATRKQMLTFVKAYTYGVASSYGLGVSRVRFQGRTSYGHTGALAGTRASIRYFPKDRVTVAVLFNRESFVGDDVVRILAPALFPKGSSPSPGASPRSSTAP